jgi:ATP-dependent protease Clp ATPase subunit
MSRTAAPEQSSCSFCDKSPNEVRALIEGGCRSRNNPSSPCVFICDECVAFCAQIIADTVGNAKEPHKN